jgi:hypothetical protein
MLTDLQRDILIKSREGIKEGMWCTGAWFAPSVVEEDGVSAVYSIHAMDDVKAFEAVATYPENLETIAAYHRCAEGEIAFRTMLAGGTWEDYVHILTAVSEHLDVVCRQECNTVESHNDTCMADFAKLDGGQEWAHIFDEVITKLLL